MREFSYQPPMTELDIIHQDQHILIVNKPDGLLSVPGKGLQHKDCLQKRLQDRFANILTIHRLDMATSGIMVFALTPYAQRHIGLQFEHRRIKKHYIALVSGCPKDETGEIDLPLICDWPNRPKQKVDYENGKQAITNWEVIEYFQEYSRIKLMPKTGRSHQLRVHMQAIGHPILGDAFYAEDNAYNAANRLMLHAESLDFHHPDGGDRVCFNCPAPF